MPDFPSYEMPPPPILTPFSPDSIGLLASAVGSSSLAHAASSGWTTANSAWLYPFHLTAPAIVYQLLFYVGATSSGNIDVGVYDAQGNLIVSAGTTAMSATTNTVQEINVADTVLAPGDYYLAGACSTTAGTCFRVGIADEILLPSLPVYQKTTSMPLPSTMAMPVLNSQATVPIYAIGAQLRSVF